ncbi:hypothetical protein BGW80DRAFT_856032 [Lactifluus volemus]|nr:hypothetical protein BGW80DRAFT_856032 [Lactifluus volemus]
MCPFEQVTQVVVLNQRWAISWMTTLCSRYVFSFFSTQVGVIIRAYRVGEGESSDLKPLRIPPKRRNIVRHILIKPEQMPQSVRFKIKLVAASYLLAMMVSFPPSHDAAVGKRAKRPVGSRQAAAEDTSESGGLYPFQLALTKKKGRGRGIGCTAGRGRLSRVNMHRNYVSAKKFPIFSLWIQVRLAQDTEDGHLPSGV